MKAIITGATGGLGRNLLEYLQSLGWEVLAFGRNTKLGDKLGVTFKGFDLSDEKKCFENFETADIVFHCAALSSPWGKYDDFYMANVVATKNVITSMRKYKIPKLVHVSTSSIYFDFEDMKDIKEEFIPKSFVNDYAKTKYEAEQVVLKSDIYSTIIRPRAIFGKYDSVLVPRLEKVVSKGFIPLIKDKSVMVDVTYVGNVVHAMYLSAIKNDLDKEIFNITNDEPNDIKILFLSLMNSIKKDVKFKYKSYGLLDNIAKFFELIGKIGLVKEPMLTRYGIGVISFSQTLDISKAKKLLDYEPKYTIDEGLDIYAKWRNKTL